MREKVNRALAFLLVVTVVLDPLLAWLRFTGVTRLNILRENCLPLHLCDVAALVLAVALWRKNQRCAELGYLWGMSGTTQGLVTPALEFPWQSPEFFAFFAQHGGVPLAGLGLVFGMNIRPLPGALKRVFLCSWLYMALVLSLNSLLSTNYGYLNGKPRVPSLMDHLGPWPCYLVSLQAVGLVFFSLWLALAKWGTPKSGLGEEKY